MLTYEDIAGPWENHADLTDERAGNIIQLLIPACSMLEERMRVDGVVFPVNPKTGTGVSGETFGGFRPQSCQTGAPKSNHKQGLAVDRYDPANEIDTWCMAHLDILEECGIWIEHPSKTPTWSHWQCVPPKSGRRVFLP
jgi:hypothetical protein